MASDGLTDRLGSVASTLCAIHCAICAFLPVIFTAVGLNFLLNQSAEWLFSLVAIAFGVGALILGWRRHRSKTVAALLTLGVVGILASRGLEMGSDHHGHDDAHHEEAVADGAKSIMMKPIMMSTARPMVSTARPIVSMTMAHTPWVRWSVCSPVPRCCSDTCSTFEPFVGVARR